MSPITSILTKTSLICILYVTLIFPQVISAQTKNTKPGNLSATVRIILPDTAFIKGTTVKFEMYKDGINTGYSKDLDSYQFDITAPATVFKIPLTSAVNYGKVSLKSPFFRKPYHKSGDLPLHSNLIKSLYLFQSGDTIDMHISKDTVMFNGKGNEKYNCLTKLNNVSRSKVYQIGGMIAPETKKFNLIKAYFDKEYLFYRQKLDMLAQYRNQLDTGIYLLINADLWGEYNDQLTNVLYRQSVSNGKRTNNWHDIVEKAYWDLQAQRDTNIFSEEIRTKSLRYCDFLYKRARFETILTSNPDAPYYHLNYTFKDLFERIKGKYKGAINDKLILTSFLAELNRRSDINLYFAVAIKDMGENSYKAALQRLAKLSSGKAFPFELSDEKGTVHKLNDFSGKLLIMDFWFTGCSPCSLLAEQMKPIIASYKKNPNVVFVTVNVDLDKKTWIKSMKEGKYSSPHELNLFTDGLATNHPMVRHYNVAGFPFLLVISKEGKVISTAPPRPFKHVPGSDEAFKEFINQYL